MTDQFRSEIGTQEEGRQRGDALGEQCVCCWGNIHVFAYGRVRPSVRACVFAHMCVYVCEESGEGRGGSSFRGLPNLPAAPNMYKFTYGGGTRRNLTGATHIGSTGGSRPISV